MKLYVYMCILYRFFIQKSIAIHERVASWCDKVKYLQNDRTTTLRIFDYTVFTVRVTSLKCVTPGILKVNPLIYFQGGVFGNALCRCRVIKKMK